MPRIGVEPTHLTVPDPKSGVSASFTTWACYSSIAIIHILYKVKMYERSKYWDHI